MYDPPGTWVSNEALRLTELLLMGDGIDRLVLSDSTLGRGHLQQSERRLATPEASSSVRWSRVRRHDDHVGKGSADAIRGVTFVACSWPVWPRQAENTVGVER